MTELQVIEQKRRETIEETRRRRDKSMRGIVTVSYTHLFLNEWVLFGFCCSYF